MMPHYCELAVHFLLIITYLNSTNRSLSGLNIRLYFQKLTVFPSPVLYCNLLFLSSSLVCKCFTVYYLVSISIHAAHCYLYESEISLSALMKFHIHENFQSNLQPWNASWDYLCELCMVNRRGGEGLVRSTDTLML